MVNFHGNATGTLRWNHVYSPKLFSNISLIYSRYRFTIFNESIDRDSKFSLRYYSGIEDFGAKADFDYFASPQHQIKFGGQSTWHVFTPAAFVVKDSELGENRSQIRR